MRTEDVRADSLTAFGDILVESPEDGRRQSLPICEYRQVDSAVYLRVRQPNDNIASRNYSAGDTVTVVKRTKSRRAA